MLRESIIASADFTAMRAIVSLFDIIRSIAEAREIDMMMALFNEARWLIGRRAAHDLSSRRMMAELSPMSMT